MEGGIQAVSMWSWRSEVLIARSQIYIHKKKKVSYLHTSLSSALSVINLEKEDFFPCHDAFKLNYSTG